jgi:hypothetical protein
MRIVEQSANRLIFHDSPWGLRAIGALFGLGGSGVLAVMIWGGHSGEHNAWVAFVVGSMFAVAGVAIALTAADRRIDFDRTAKIVRVIRRGGVLRAETSDYPFATIRDIALESSSGVAQNRNVTTGVYRIVLVLRDGSRVPWTAVSTSDMGAQAHCVSAARGFGGWDTAAARSGAAATEVARPTPPLGIPVAVASPVVSVANSLQVARGRGTQNMGCVMLFLGIFSLVGVGLMAMQVERLLVWRPVAATVVATTIDAVRGSKGGTSYRPVVTYSYEVDGRWYRSSAVTIISTSRSWALANGIVTRYRIGARTTAWADPNAPGRAYLIHELSLFPLIFIGIPVAFGAIVLCSSRWNERQTALAAAVPVPVVPSTVLVSSRAA